MGRLKDFLRRTDPDEYDRRSRPKMKSRIEEERKRKIEVEQKRVQEVEKNQERKKARLLESIAPLTIFLKSCTGDLTEMFERYDSSVVYAFLEEDVDLKANKCDISLGVSANKKTEREFKKSRGFFGGSSGRFRVQNHRDMTYRIGWEYDFTKQQLSCKDFNIIIDPTSFQHQEERIIKFFLSLTKSDFKKKTIRTRFKDEVFNPGDYG